MSLTVGSLFSGIGGLELGLERAGMVVKWQVEQDDYCRAVLAKHWPNVKRYEDVRDVGRHNLEPVDLICGGFPCQDTSNAGKRVGIRGERSGLWAEYGRIIRELRPRYVFVENVAALLGRGLDVVLGDLHESGYDAEWDCIPASAVGAPHQRDRLWIVAYAPPPQRGVYRPPAGRENLADTEIMLRDGGNVYRGGDQESSDALPEPRDGGAADGPEIWWSAEPDVGRVAHGVPARVDRLRALGNAVVPQVAEWIGKRIVEAHEEMTPPSTREKAS